MPSTASIYNPSGQTNNFINPSNQQPFASQPPIQLVQTAPPINFFNPIQLDAASSTSLNSSQRSTPASFVNQPLPSAPILSKNPSPADITKPPVPFFQPQQVFQTQSVQPVPTEKSDSPPKFLAPIEQVHAAEAILDNSPKISDFNQSEITTPSNFFQPTPPGKCVDFLYLKYQN